jgi:hypothetical protein
VQQRWEDGSSSTSDAYVSESEVQNYIKVI